ncbi:MAG: aminotransferase class I/II-fold pyridoxal phosphate-dependent enzyme [Paracoccaceae bacterium]
MIDFTSTLYLGLGHASASLGPWRALSTGRPAALAPPEGQRAAEIALARLTGADDAMLLPSSLHAFSDLFDRQPAAGGRLLVEAGGYPVGHASAARAVARGVGLGVFAHHDAAALARALRAAPGAVVLVDGCCASCGRPPPLARYLALVAEAGATLVIDDTQTLGLLGRAAGQPAGGGVLTGLDDGAGRVLVIASLAKGRGVPAAVLAGGRGAVARLRRASATAVHNSPVSACHLAALHAALGANRREGAWRRRRLARLVAAFRDGLACAGLAPLASRLPIVTLPLGAAGASRAVQGALLARGVRAVARRLDCLATAGVSFFVTARHTLEEIRAATEAVGAALRALAARPGPPPFRAASALQPTV